MSSKKKLSSALLAFCALASQSVHAQESEIFNLPAQQLSESLKTLGLQANINVVVKPDLVDGYQAPAVAGSFTVQQVLAHLLAGSALEYQFIDERTVVVKQKSSGARTGSRDGALRLAQATKIGDGEHLDEVVVTGSYIRRSANSATGLNMTLRETPQSVTVITHARMEDQNLTEISDVLGQAVGITYDGSPLGSDGSNYFSRGFAVTNYQINGVPRPSGIYGFGKTTSDMVSYDRIEIIRGATGLMNGVGNPSASVNLIRKRPTTNFSGQFLAQVGSWNQYRVEADLGGSVLDSGRMRGRLATSYQQGDSHIDRAHLDKKSVYGVLEFDLQDATLLSLGLEYQDFSNKEMPRGGLPLYFSDGTTTNFPRSSNAAAPWSSLTRSSTSVFASVEHQLSKQWLVKVIAEHERPEYDESMGYIASNASYGYVDRVTGSGSSLISARWAADLEQDFLGAYVQGDFEWWGRQQQLVFGMNYSKSSADGPAYCGWFCGGDYRQSVVNIYDVFAGREGFQPDLTPAGNIYGPGDHNVRYIEQNSAYAALRLKPLDNVSAILGTRMSNWRERRWTRTRAGQKTYRPDNEEKNVLTPYLGVVVDLRNNVSAYASVTEIFEPQAYEDINGRKLPPLEGINYELGAKAEFFDDRLNVSAGVFRVKQDNFPVQVANVFNPQTGGYVYEARSGAVSKGFELEIGGELRPGWQMVGGFSRAEPEDRNGQPMLVYVPTDNFKLFSSYRFSGALTGLTLGGNFRWQNEALITYAPGPNGELYREGSLALVDLMAKYEFSNSLLVQLNVTNLLDEVYYTTGRAMYGQPRAAAASMRWTF